MILTNINVLDYDIAGCCLQIESDEKKLLLTLSMIMKELVCDSEQDFILIKSQYLHEFEELVIQISLEDRDFIEKQQKQNRLDCPELGMICEMKHNSYSKVD